MVKTSVALDYCIKPHENYAPIELLEEEVAETVQGWMDSPGHRRNLLNPAHTLLNIGIAYDRYNQVMVQHFASDYVSYITKPAIGPDGILQFEAEVSGATLYIGDTTNVQIYYDPPAQPLTRGQLSFTYSLCYPIAVAYLARPLPPGSFYITPPVRREVQQSRCVDPYMTDRDHPAPNSNQEAHAFWAEAKATSNTNPPVNTEVMRIIAAEIALREGGIKLSADLSPILERYGPGIYTVFLWGRPLPMDKSAVISEQSIFWMTSPPAASPYVEGQE